MQDSFELDKRIAKLLGWTWDNRQVISPSGERQSRCQIRVEDKQYHDNLRSCIPKFSTDMDAAWEAVEHLTNNGYCPALLFDDNGHWSLSLDGAQDVNWNDKQDMWTSFWVDAGDWHDTAPLAICSAFVNALEVEPFIDSPSIAPYSGAVWIEAR